MNLYEPILHFKNTSVTLVSESTIAAIITETTIFAHISTTAFVVAEAELISSIYAATSNTNTNNNNNKTYFIKFRGISQGDLMEGFPLYCGGNRRE